MAIVPIRDIGSYGVNTDVDPLDLPITAFSYAANVRFTNNKINRGPVFAEIGSATDNASPRWAYSYRLQGASSTYLVMNQNGTVAQVQSSSPGTLTYTDKSVAAYTPSSQDQAYTSCMLANVVYINRNDRVPWSMTPAASQFSTLAGGWDSTWRCKALRSFNGALVAINITKGATEYPTMVKTSDFAVYATIPGTWTAATNNSATENVLTDLTEPLVDGWTLRDKFILYTPNETWAMVPSGDNIVYNYQRLFANYGAISTNCVAEVNNLHFVFGDNDLWMHDGYNPKPLANGRIRKFIFDNLIKAQKYQFFVWSNPKLNEVMFCYVSDDPYCAFPVNSTIGYPGCNKAAVYNWFEDKFTFYDLPYIVGGGLGEITGGLTYSGAGSVTYDSMSATYLGLSDDTRLYNLAVGRGGSVTAPVLPLQTTGTWSTSALHLYSFEPLENNVGLGSFVEATIAPPFCEMLQLDMDEVSKEIKAYKLVSTIYPEGRIENSSNPLTFWWGSSDYSGQEANWGDAQTFDGQSLYKLDFRNPGRYLSFRMALANPPQRFTLSGMDIDYKLLGHR